MVDFPSEHLKDNISDSILFPQGNFIAEFSPIFLFTNDQEFVDKTRIYTN